MGGECEEIHLQLIDSKLDSVSQPDEEEATFLKSSLTPT